VHLEAGTSAKCGVGRVAVGAVKDHPGVDVAFQWALADVDTSASHWVQVLPVKLATHVEGGRHGSVADLGGKGHLGHDLACLRVELPCDLGRQADVVVTTGNVMASEEERANAARAGNQVGLVIGIKAQEAVL